MVTANESGAVIFNKTVPLERDEFRKFEVDFPAVGNYTITTTDADGEVYQYVWTVERLPPSFEIIVTAERRGNVSYLKSSA